MTDKRLIKAFTLATLILVISMALAVYAQEAAAGASFIKAYSRLGAGLGFGLAALGAGVGVGVSGAAAISALVERRELLAMYLVFVALAEAIAIYGFVVFFLLI